MFKLGSFALLLAACGASNDSVPGGGVDAGGNPPGGAGWTKMALLGDRADDDVVTGIDYSKPVGVIVTAGHQNEAGGAVFTASPTAVTALAFDGSADTPSGLIGGIQFTGITTTPSGGFIALANANDVVIGDAAGHFSIERNGGEDKGGNEVYAMRVTAAGTTLIEHGAVYTSTSAPGPSASYTEQWAPQAEPSVPAAIPDADCTAGPKNANLPATHDVAYINADASVIMYTQSPTDGAAGVCVSTDHGASFVPATFANLSDETQNQATPNGIAFASAQTAVVWWASPTDTASSNYIERTTDRGTTWARVALPAAIASHSLELLGGFFAPDGEHGWIVGYDATSSAALAIVTADGGATWAPDATGMAATIGDAKLYSGFATDATHVWVGGDHGALAAYQP